MCDRFVGGGSFCLPHPWAAPKMPILNRVKDLARRAASNKVLRDKAFNIAKNLKYDEHQRGLASMVYSFFDRKSSSGAIWNQKHSSELHKPII